MELLSPSVQTPRALAVFCAIHLGLSLALDITVGLVAKVRHLGYLTVIKIVGTGTRYRIKFCERFFKLGCARANFQLGK